MDRTMRGIGLVYAERYSQESYIKQFWDMSMGEDEQDIRQQVTDSLAKERP